MRLVQNENFPSTSDHRFSGGFGGSVTIQNWRPGWWMTEPARLHEALARVPLSVALFNLRPIATTSASRSPRNHLLEPARLHVINRRHADRLKCHMFGHDPFDSPLTLRLFITPRPGIRLHQGITRIGLPAYRPTPRRPASSHSLRPRVAS